MRPNTRWNEYGIKIDQILLILGVICRKMRIAKEDLCFLGNFIIFWKYYLHSITFVFVIASAKVQKGMSPTLKHFSMA